MTVLVGPVPCHDCHARLFLKRYRGRIRWLEPNRNTYQPWRVHICTAKPVLSPREQNTLNHRHASWREKMSLAKLGGSMRYEDLGPGSPGTVTHYTVGGRSVHADGVSSGISKGTVRDTRSHSKRGPGEAYKSAPFVIKRNKNLARTVEE